MATETEIGDVLERPRATRAVPFQSASQPIALKPRSSVSNPWPATDEKLSGAAAVAIWLVCIAASIALALTLIDAWSKV